jgi:ATP-dependent Clp protease adaptor protein ClpS
MLLLFISILESRKNCVIFCDMSDFQKQAISSDVFSEEQSFELPPECKVIFFNDNYTTMDFVTEVLVSIFNKSHAEAEALMLAVHNNGSAVVGTYTYDIAVSRTNLTKSIAKKKVFLYNIWCVPFAQTVALKGTIWLLPRGRHLNKDGRKYGKKSN